MCCADCGFNSEGNGLYTLVCQIFPFHLSRLNCSVVCPSAWPRYVDEYEMEILLNTQCKHCSCMHLLLLAYSLLAAAMLIILSLLHSSNVSRNEFNYLELG